MRIFMYKPKKKLGVIFMEELKVDILSRSIRISCVLNHLLFPLTTPEIIDSLETREFQVGRQPTPLPVSQRSYISGSIARKNDVFVNLDNNQKLIGAQGHSIDNTLKVFTELLEILVDDFSIDLENDLKYAEFIGHYLVKTDNNPYKVITKSVEVKNKDKLETILNDKLVTYRLYLSPENILFQSPNWYEINISPKVTMSDNAYWLETIYRNVKTDPVIEYAQNFRSTIERIIETLEE